MRLVFTLIALTLATTARAAPADPLSGLAWMSGSWIEARDGVVTRETWLPPLGDAMAGTSQTNAPGRKPRIEHMTITAEPGGVTFTAILPGQPPTPFALRPRGSGDEAVFENPGHDFPQRVIYRPCGENLCARIEGVVKGAPASKSWVYRPLR